LARPHSGPAGRHLTPSCSASGATDEHEGCTLSWGSLHKCASSLCRHPSRSAQQVGPRLVQVANWSRQPLSGDSVCFLLTLSVTAVQRKRSIVCACGCVFIHVPVCVCVCVSVCTCVCVQSSSVQSCLTLCDPMDCSTPGLPVHHQLLEFTQTHVH